MESWVYFLEWAYWVVLNLSTMLWESVRQHIPKSCKEESKNQLQINSLLLTTKFQDLKLFHSCHLYNQTIPAIISWIFKVCRFSTFQIFDMKHDTVCLYCKYNTHSFFQWYASVYSRGIHYFIKQKKIIITPLMELSKCIIISTRRFIYILPSCFRNLGIVQTG